MRLRQIVKGMCSPVMLECYRRFASVIRNQGMRLRQIAKGMCPPVMLLGWNRFILVIRNQRAKKKFEGQNRLHLACGRNVLIGWANVDLVDDGNVIGWDLTARLPIRDGSIELIYSEHFIEHITLEQTKTLLVDCYRFLRPNGILRLSTPSLEKTIKEYQLGRLTEWHDVGFFPATPCQMINEGFRLWGHQFIYDFAELKRILEEVGFQTVSQTAWHESSTPALRNLECRPFHGEIILEATK